MGKLSANIPDYFMYEKIQLKYRALCLKKLCKILFLRLQRPFEFKVEHTFQTCSYGLHTLPSLSFTLTHCSNCERQVPSDMQAINPLNPELNPICYLLALLAHHFLHVSRIRVKSLTIKLLMPYIYGAPILDVSRSHTTTQHSR